jgi:hypothetical protein
MSMMTAKEIVNSAADVKPRHGVPGLAEHLAKQSSDKVLVIGPCVYRLDSRCRKEWYFIVGAFDHAFHLTALSSDCRGTCTALRQTLVGSLLTTHRALVVHDFDHEASMVRCCATLWPCEETRRIADEVSRSVH